MQVYLINLDRRPDRLAWSAKELRQFGIAFSRVAAIDGDQAAVPDSGQRFCPHPRFLMTKGELGCFLSHLKTWNRFLMTGDEYCVVLEDDVVVSPGLGPFLRAFTREKLSTSLIHLETYLEPVVLTKRPRHRVGGVALHQFHTFHSGAAAYIISRQLASKLITAPVLPLLPVDHLLFDPISPFMKEVKPYQAVPGLCVQGDQLSEVYRDRVFLSDLENDRLQSRQSPTNEHPVKVRKSLTSTQKVRREFLRLLRQLAKQLYFKKITVPFATAELPEWRARDRDGNQIKAKAPAPSYAGLAVLSSKQRA